MLGFFAPSHAVTLEEAISESLKNSNEIAASKQSWLAAREALYSKQSSNEHELKFSGSGSFSQTYDSSDWSTSNTYSNKITLSKTIYDFGKSDQNIVLAKLQLDSAFAKYKSVEQQSILKTVKAYLDLIKVRQESQLNQKNISRLAAHVEAARLRVSEGTDTPTRVAEARSQFLQAKADEARANAKLRNAEDLFERLTGLNMSQMANVKNLPEFYPNLPEDEESTAIIAGKNNHDVLTSLIGEQIASQSIETFKAQQKPGVSFSLSATEGQSSDGWSASVSVSAPLYSGASTEADGRKMVADHSSARINLQEVRHKVQVEARSAFRDWEAANIYLEAVTSGAAASRMVANGVRDEVKYGLKTTLDLLDVEKNVNDAELRLINAEHDKLVSAFSLMAVIGSLGAEAVGVADVSSNLDDLPRPPSPLD